MAPAYATEAQYVDFAGDVAPDDVARLLVRASELLDDIMTASFAVDAETGLPTDSQIAEALSNACCAQVEFWQEVGEGHDVDGLAGTTYMLTGTTGYQGKRAHVLAPRALRFLRQARLL